MKYVQLSEDYRDDHLAEAMYAREVEWFHYDFDRANFERMLEALPDGEYKDMIAKRLGETLGQMAQVELIYEALKAQITDPTKHAAAVARVALRREVVREK